MKMTIRLNEWRIESPWYCGTDWIDLNIFCTKIIAIGFPCSIHKWIFTCKYIGFPANIYSVFYKMCLIYISQKFRSRWVEACKVGLKSKLIWGQDPLRVYNITCIWWDQEGSFLRYWEKRMDESMWHCHWRIWVCLLEFKLGKNCGIKFNR